jgi:hypothetical protein
MLHEYHIIYSVRCYRRFHVIAVGLGTYYPWLRGHYCIYFTNQFLTLKKQARKSNKYCSEQRELRFSALRVGSLILLKVYVRPVLLFGICQLGLTWNYTEPLGKGKVFPLQA